jgi:hypothetical protein
MPNHALHRTRTSRAGEHERVRQQEFAMPISKGPHFQTRDIFIDYPHEEVMYSWDHMQKRRWLSETLNRPLTAKPVLFRQTRPLERRLLGNV